MFWCHTLALTEISTKHLSCWAHHEILTGLQSTPKFLSLHASCNAQWLLPPYNANISWSMIITYHPLNISWAKIIIHHLLNISWIMIIIHHPRTTDPLKNSILFLTSVSAWNFPKGYSLMLLPPLPLNPTHAFSEAVKYFLQNLCLSASNKAYFAACLTSPPCSSCPFIASMLMFILWFPWDRNLSMTIN